VYRPLVASRYRCFDEGSIYYRSCAEDASH
jgi:hypothetical protein